MLIRMAVRWDSSSQTKPTGHSGSEGRRYEHSLTANAKTGYSNSFAVRWEYSQPGPEG